MQDFNLLNLFKKIKEFRKAKAKIAAGGDF